MICVDASVAIKAITDEKDSHAALDLFKKWSRVSQELIAPALIDYEVSSVLCRKAHLGDIKNDQAIQAFRLYQELGIKTSHDWQVAENALLIARSFGARSAYDFVYLVYAQSMNAELVTADHKFSVTVQTGYPFVKFFK
jgi:predicted nucleic acid-binding protein